MTRIFSALFLLGLMAVPTGASARIIDAKWEPASGDVIRFDVLRQGKPFGIHQVAFERDAQGRLVARTKVDLKAGLGPITLFRYELDATEVWRDGQLVSLQGSVRDDGTKGQVRAERTGDKLDVDGTMFEGQVPGSMLPSSHWNVAQTEASSLLSTEDGEMLEVSVSELGRETLSIAGETVEATRYLMDSDIDVHLWYDDAGRWVKLAFTARGQEIEYVLTRLY